MRNRRRHWTIVAALLLFSSAASAGPYSDDLSRCLVDSSTTADKIGLVKWVFTAISLHPAVKSIGSVTQEEFDAASQEAAATITRMMTKTCREQTANALRYEGEAAISESFGVFGSVAARELFSNPAVAAGIGGLKKYLDAAELKKALGMAP